jgi:hypothetical protein
MKKLQQNDERKSKKVCNCVTPRLLVDIQNNRDKQNNRYTNLTKH